MSPLVVAKTRVASQARLFKASRRVRLSFKGQTLVSDDQASQIQRKQLHLRLRPLCARTEPVSRADWTFIESSHRYNQVFLETLDGRLIEMRVRHLGLRMLRSLAIKEQALRKQRLLNLPSQEHHLLLVLLALARPLTGTLLLWLGIRLLVHRQIQLVSRSRLRIRTRALQLRCLHQRRRGNRTLVTRTEG